jgi:hypothetical protein
MDVLLTTALQLEDEADMQSSLESLSLDTVPAQDTQPRLGDILCAKLEEQHEQLTSLNQKMQSLTKTLESTAMKTLC